MVWGRRGSVARTAAWHLPQSISQPPEIWQHPSTQPLAGELPLCRAISMSGAGALGPLGPEGAGAHTGDVPSLTEIEQLLNSGRPSCNHVDEVWPNLFLGDL